MENLHEGSEREQTKYDGEEHKSGDNQREERNPCKFSHAIAKR
jgi:hypothetical protein